jgi:dihydrolipoamide dehydrogenase
MADVVVVGAGPAGVIAALRAAELGARTTLIEKTDFGGMAANDGPVPVRVLAHTARLLRDAKQLGTCGVTVGEPVLDYPRLLQRVRDVVADVRARSSLRTQIDSAGVVVHEQAGAARFVDPHTIVTEAGLRLRADRVVLCTGGVSRRLPIPGFELTSTHSDAWKLRAVPPSMLVVGAGATGVQVASIFNALGSRVQLWEAAPRILATEDEEIAAGATAAFREAGIVVRERFGTIESFEKTAAGVRMNFTRDGHRDGVEATLAVIAVGWVADVAGLGLAEAGVQADRRGFIAVDDHLQTTAPHVFAAGDAIGRVMLVPQAIEGGFVAATNAVRGRTLPVGEHVSATGSFTDPEYARVGLTEADARAEHDVAIAIAPFRESTRTVIDGRTTGFCKLVADRKTARVLGVHVLGERAVDIAEVAAMAIEAGMGVDDLARIPLAYPTYAGVLARVAARAARDLGRDIGWQVHGANAPD